MGLGVLIRLLALVLLLVEEGGSSQIVLACEVDSPVAVDEVRAGGVAEGQVVVSGLGLRGSVEEDRLVMRTRLVLCRVIRGRK